MILTLQTLVSILAAYGMSNMLVYGSVFGGMRRFLSEHVPFLGNMLECMMCTGFWVGFLVSLAAFSPCGALGMAAYTDNSAAITTFFDACLFSGAIWLLHTWQESVERRNAR